MKPGTNFNPYRAESVVYDKRLIMESPNPIEILIDDFIKANNFRLRINLKKKALNNLLSNILVAEKENKVLALPRGSWAYANSSFYGLDYYSHATIVGLVDSLKDEGFIYYSRGFFNKEKNKGVVSRVWATEKLLDRVNLIASVPFTDNEESEESSPIHYLFGQKLKRVKFTKPILLKDGNKKLISYKVNNKTLKMHQQINQYNDFINQYSVTIPKAIIHNTTSNGSPILVELGDKSLDYIELDCSLYRVFNGRKFTLGGRFYGAEYQSLNEEQRAKILIDGEETCEVDYSACNIRMLYHLEGLEYKSNPYKIVNSDSWMQLYIKKMFHILINAKSLPNSIAAYRKYVNDETLTNDVQSELKLNAWELAKTIMEKHKKIEKYFNTGVGVKLQYKDSRIAERILKHFTRKHIVCLCIHDSFIVKQQYQDELIEVMHREYKRGLGFDCELKVNKRIL